MCGAVYSDVCLFPSKDCASGTTKTKSRRLFLMNDQLVCTSLIQKYGPAKRIHSCTTTAIRGVFLKLGAVGPWWATERYSGSHDLNK